MKVIDLLNKIANGEIPKIIVYDERYFTYDDKRQNYFTYDDSEIDWKYTVMEYINDEIEIIEDTPKEDKKIVKIDVAWQNVFDEQAQQDFAKMTLDKLNEIIDRLNGEDNE